MFHSSSSPSRARARGVRPLVALLHRFAGLFMAGFLFVAGLTGALLAWSQELDRWLNPELLQAHALGPALSSLELARAVEARHPGAQVTMLPLAPEPGRSLELGVDPRVDPTTGKPYELGFDEVFVDPASGAELGTRHWSANWPITRATFVSFLYELHYGMHLPRWGMWLMGGVGLLWAIDCFFGLYLTLPARKRKAAAAEPSLPGSSAVARSPAARSPAPKREKKKSWLQRWQPSWRVRWRGGAYKINFDLHRAGGLWTWAVLFILAFSGFSMNLYREVFLPVVSAVARLTPSPLEQRRASSARSPITPALGFAEAVARARSQALQRGWPEPAGSVSYAPNLGVYTVSFHAPEASEGPAGGGPRQLFVDARDGQLIGASQPWTGTAGDLFVKAQFPLHSGRILGKPGRVLISLVGIVVAMLSVTGVVIWWRKRRSRVVERVHSPEPVSERPREAFSS